MRIGFFDPYLDTLTGGERYILTAASCMGKNNSVSLFWDDKSILERAKDKFNLNLQEVQVVKNIFSTKVSFFNRLIESKKYDVIFYLSDGSIPFLISKKTFLHFQFPVSRIRGKSMSNKIKFRKITGSICNSFFTKEFIDKTYGIDSTVIYPPVQIGDRHVSLLRKDNIILSVGRFSLDQNGILFKKQDFLTSVFKEMVDKGLKKWKLVLVISYLDKDKDSFEKFKRSIDKYPIEIHSHVSNVEIMEFYNNAKIYWHAAGYGEDLDMHPEKAEHFGIATVEAMGHHLVPVVINAGGQKEIIRNDRNGFLWNDKEELINKTLYLIKNENIRTKMAYAAYLDADRFSSEKFCKELTGLLR